MDHEALLKTVAKAAGIDAQAAERAIRATLVTLGERISEGEGEDLARHLPDSLAPLIVQPGDAEGFGADEFFRRVAEREGVDPETAERHARAVVAALAPREGRKEFHDMLSQLPRALRERLLAPPTEDRQGADAGTSPETSPELLVVLSGADNWTLADGTSHPTGFWAEELVAPMRVFREAAVHVTFATPGGVRPTVDEASLTPDAAGGEAQAAELRAELEALSGELASPVALEEVSPADFDGIFIPGGHGPMQDLSVSAELGRLLVALSDGGKVVAAVCHGPAGLLSAVRDDGTWAFAGRQISAFTNEEETQAGLADQAPWLLEDRIRAAGGEVRTADSAWAPYAVVDGNLVTGQNPASSTEAAERTVERLAGRRSGLLQQ